MLGRYNRQMTVESKWSSHKLGKSTNFQNACKLLSNKFVYVIFPLRLLVGFHLRHIWAMKLLDLEKNGSVRDVDAIAYCKNESDIQKIRVLNKNFELSEY